MGDRYPKRVMVTIALLCSTVALVPFALANSLWPVLLWAGVYGFAWGVRAPIQFSMVGEYFGRASYGKIQGWINGTAVPLGALGPILAGVLADWRGNYTLPILLMSGITATAAALYFMALPPKPPARALRTASARIA